MNKKRFLFIAVLFIAVLFIAISFFIIKQLEVVPGYYLRVVDKTTKFPIKNAIAVIHYADGLPSVQGVVPGREKNIIVFSDENGYLKVDGMWYIHFLFHDLIEISIKEPLYETQRKIIFDTRPSVYFSNHKTTK